MNWLDDITREDLHEKYQEMMDVLTPMIGDAKSLEVILRLAGHYNSQPFYFRSLKEIISDRKRKYIIEHFNGSNHVDLARATGFGLQYVYDILAEDRNKKQPSFFSPN